MKKLFHIIIPILLFSTVISAQKLTTLGCGPNGYLNLPSTVTISEGTILSVSGNSSSSMGSFNFSWGTFPAKYVYIHSVINTSNSSLARIEFAKPGTYQLYFMISNYMGMNYKSATIIVLPSDRKGYQDN